ncbi:hypothetical protein [Paraflavitalea sp. CAU 1676]|uniref:hypothetical protein n=1 Tax=Paraflavitalea sp. CAU 1676 TaxID=3032598 RepID=UPI0023DCE4D1|nr:hypothetical protein [Paraflavitalea sp. CAU 1676]MDF2188123.1 hypothetical protein [Paraflavitalea sp. CAU 1676]
MKKYVIALCVVLLTGLSMVQAQDQPADKTAAAKRITDSMTVKLHLTTEQVPKVQAINESFTAKAAVVKTEGGDRATKMKKLKEANQEREKALKEVLTSEQFQAYKENKKEMRSDARERYKGKKRTA